MAARGGAAGALEHELPAHELAIIFADRARLRARSRGRARRRLGPLPDVAERSAAGARASTAPARSSWLPRLGSAERRRNLPIRLRSAGARRPSGRRRRPRNKLMCATGAAGSIVAPSGEGEMAAVAAPVERRATCLRADPVPAFADSHSVGRRIAAVGDEFAPFAVGDAAVGDGVGVEQRLVARPFAVEGESRSPVRRSRPARRGPAGSSTVRPRGTARRRAIAIGRFERILGEGGEDVGQEQLLVLLLMIDAELDQLERAGGQVGQDACRAPRRHGARQSRTSSSDRPAEHAALRPRMALALALVIAVEQIRRSARRTAGSPATWSRSTKVSKNQVVCARCHLAGEASGSGWIVASASRQRRGEIERQRARRARAASRERTWRLSL